MKEKNMNNFTSLLNQMKTTQEYIEKASPLACSSNKKAMEMLTEICNKIAGETNSANTIDLWGDSLQHQKYISPDEDVSESSLY